MTTCYDKIIDVHFSVDRSVLLLSFVDIIYIEIGPSCLQIDEDQCLGQNYGNHLCTEEKREVPN